LSHQANDYVKKLFRDRVTRRQKLLLWSLADYHNTSRRAAWPAIRTLAEESLMDIRECRRVLLELEEAGLIQRIKGGDGAGDFNEYRLIELDGKDGHMTPLQSGTQNSNKGGQKDGRKGGQKDGQNERAIRKEREPEREQVPPYPPAGGLTPRQLQNLSKELSTIYAASVGVYDDDFDDKALRKACQSLCLPLDAARKAIAESEGR
jgi:predicted transcriptional regulator